MYSFHTEIIYVLVFVHQQNFAFILSTLLEPIYQNIIKLEQTSYLLSVCVFCCSMIIVVLDASVLKKCLQLAVVNFFIYWHFLFSLSVLQSLAIRSLHQVRLVGGLRRGWVQTVHVCVHCLNPFPAKESVLLEPVPPRNNL